ncbi:PREDICTED: CD320 antigen [Gavialis gangeticus]|uniref:CD320 antigen n=1 Tax=Gavialis gangeticus TaxID=94835 RepID=UPI00092FD39F|nr:PREDICTED: CD320 antigen [Gavialis gangeticus]
MADRRVLVLLLVLAGLLVPARLQSSAQGPAPCPEHEFRCAPGGACFPRTWLCDGHDDCDHGEDERDCAAPSAEAPPCGAGEFRCLQGGCVPLRQACDGERDCADGSDESTCSTPGLPCEPHLWQCRTTKLCLPRGHLCDGHRDCPDGTDESAEACQLREALSSVGPSTASTETPYETPGPFLHQAPLWVIATFVLLSVLVGIGCITAWRRSEKKISFTSISLEKTSKEQLVPARRPSTTFP